VHELTCYPHSTRSNRAASQERAPSKAGLTQATEENLRDQGVRLTTYPYAELMRQAAEYLANHPAASVRAGEAYDCRRCLWQACAACVSHDKRTNAKRANINHFCFADIRCEMTTIGYARVSTDGQTLDAQQAALRLAGAEKVYSEKNLRRCH
jgi:Resolvase, N terminal domain